MKNHKTLHHHTLIMLLCSLLLFGCHNNPIPDVIPPGKPTTILIYMVANNNLYGDAISNINQMEQGMYDMVQGMSEEEAKQYQSVLVYVNGTVTTTFPSPCLIRIKPDNTRNIVSELVKTYPSQNASSPETLRQIVMDADSFNVARNSIRGLVLWSHGSGWLPSGEYVAPPLIGLRAFGYDQGTVPKTDAEREMDIMDLAASLKDYHFDFIMFDACLMSSVEVCYQLKDLTNHIIAAPTEILASGCPYQIILPDFFSKDPNYTHLIAQHYFDFYNTKSGAEQSCAMSVINTSKLDELAHYFKGLNTPPITDANIQDPSKAYYINQLQGLDVEGSQYFFDMKQFITLYCQQEGLPQVQAQLGTLWNQVVEYEAHTPNFLGLPIPNNNGLSIYIPQGYGSRSLVDDYYKQYNWNLVTANP